MFDQAHMAEIVDLLRPTRTHQSGMEHNHKRRLVAINPTEDGTEIGKRSANAFRLALGLKPTLDA